MTPPIRWTGAVGFALAARTAYRADRLSDEDWWTANTAAIQHRTLRALLNKAAKTEFGRAHSFDRLAQISDDAERLHAYRAEVPVHDWYAFQDQITRMREGGEPNVLWPGLVEDFAQTSGTTAGDKFIPVTQAMFKSNYRASLDIFAHLQRWGESIPSIMSGRALFLGGSSDVVTNELGVRTGDLSGLVTKLIRWPLTEVYAPGADIALESHWPTKIERMAQTCAPMDIRFISGMPSWAIVCMERVLDLTGADTIDQVWPNLRVFVHGGVKYTPFIPRVSRLWSGDPAGDLPLRLELYPASEGFIALQDRPRDPGLRLLTAIGNFYEFVPLEEAQSDNPRAYMAHEVEPGVPYVVTMTTCAGLWRYLIGDVVEFETIPPDGPPRLRIVGRHKHFINAFGENIIVEHIEHAVAAAARETGLTVGEFTASPVYPSPENPAGLELAAEFEAPPAEHDLERFQGAFDLALKSQNVDYTTKRTDSLGMAPPTMTALPVGAFHRWMDSVGKLGGQHKCPRCANHRDIIDAVQRVMPPVRRLAPGREHAHA